MVKPHRIVIGSDTGVFWKDGITWTGDPSEAAVFDQPRAAWQQAVHIQSDQADSLGAASVELHLRDPDEPHLSKQAVSLTAHNTRLELRRQWQANFDEPLPPDLPSPLPGDEVYRVEDYLSDVDWDRLRSDHGSAEKMYAALDAGFHSTLKDVAESDREPVIKMLRDLVPRDVASVIASSWAHTPFDEPAPVSPGSPEAAADEGNEISRDRAREATSVRLSAFDQLSTPYSEASSTAASTAKTSQDQLPAFVMRHFVRAGDGFFYRQTPDKLAFETRGETFRAHDSSVSVATAMVEMAEARGWSALKVKGTKDFRRLVWAAAARRGIAVDGYSPSAGERAMLEQEQVASRPPRRDVSDARADGRQRNRPADSLAGTLVDYGPAPYQNQPENSPSYFVALRGESGKVTTQWGLDLERAIDDAKAEIGDQVQLGRSGKQRVQVQRPIRDQQGKVVDQVLSETERNTWSVSVLSRSDRTNEAQDGQRREAGDDPIANKVIELFTAERLGKLPPEEQARFRELYEQARTRLASQDNPRSAVDMGSRSDRNVISRDRQRERASQGR
ncbi:LPD7 domain-containing protein [Halochromatium roseum]|uniref:LPD7 domain-containing protein n=1 Tax=Halochromatium roseum TaxID=391920 RepID=UPI0019132E92|nr:LPD7 domain-containing protein [Halochromatium roseum]MBK5938067.1 hypothetical protein [Halochromatium roseum]